MRKLTPELIGKIRKAHGEGASVRELAEKFAVSRGSISTAINGTTTKKPTTTALPVPPPLPPLPEGDDDAEPVDPLEYVNDVLRRLRHNAEHFQRVGDTMGLARATREQANLLRVAARLGGASDPSMVLVSVAEMDAMGARVAETIEKLDAHAKAERATLPRCPTCFQPVEPPR